MFQAYPSLATIQRQLEEKKERLAATCGDDPLAPGGSASDLFSSTSASCDERMRGEVDALIGAYAGCGQVWEGIENQLETYEQLYDDDDGVSTVGDDHYTNLEAQLTELDNLWRRRQQAGTAYDAAWDTWHANDNAVKASCGFADHYLRLKDSITTEFVDKLKAKITEMRTLCSAMPTDEIFSVSKTTYPTSLPTSGGTPNTRRLLQDGPSQGTDEDGVCRQIITNMETTASNVQSQSGSRSSCLAHHCKQDKDALDISTADITNKYDTWIRADGNFTTAYEAYITNHDLYVAHLSTLFENNKTLDAGKVGLGNAKATVDASVEALENTSACAPSTICCVPPVEIPQICAANAAGNVSTHRNSVIFNLSPPPSPPPSPPSPPPPSPPPPSPPPSPPPPSPPPFELLFRYTFDDDTPRNLAHPEQPVAECQNPMTNHQGACEYAEGWNGGRALSLNVGRMTFGPIKYQDAGNFSVCLRMKASNADKAWQTAVGHWHPNEHILHLGLRRRWLTEYSDGLGSHNQITWPHKFPSGTWKHVCTVISTGPEGKKELWVDGVKEVKPNPGVPEYVSKEGTFFMAVGSKTSEGAIENQFVGQIDDLHFFKGLISEAEILALM